MMMHGTHDMFLVILSILIAMFASFTALSLATRMRTSRGWMRDMWVTAAAIALGGGIWSMHFVAMLAFTMPDLVMRYDLALTLLSLVLALTFTWAGFWVVSRSACSDSGWRWVSRPNSEIRTGRSPARFWRRWR